MPFIPTNTTQHTEAGIKWFATLRVTVVYHLRQSGYNAGQIWHFKQCQ
jgi:hypothetical protein